MLKKQEIYGLINLYYESYAPLKTYHENKVENLELYPNFQDFYKSVLIKTPKTKNNIKFYDL